MIASSYNFKQGSGVWLALESIITDISSMVSYCLNQRGALAWRNVVSVITSISYMVLCCLSQGERLAKTVRGVLCLWWLIYHRWSHTVLICENTFRDKFSVCNSVIPSMVSYCLDLRRILAETSLVFVISDVSCMVFYCLDLRGTFVQCL